MFQVQDVVERPVEVVGDVRDLLVDPVRRRTSRFPQAATGKVDGEPVGALRARDGDPGVALGIDPPVEVLQEGDVGGEHVLDDGRGDGCRACRAR